MTTPAMLPGRELALVEEAKIVGYLLNPDHPQGGAKARFFLARGVPVGQWQVLRDLMLEHARNNPVTRVREHPGGRARLFQLDCAVAMPDGSTPCIRTVWEIRADPSRPRLVTAYPNG